MTIGAAAPAFCIALAFTTAAAAPAGEIDDALPDDVRVEHAVRWLADALVEESWLELRGDPSNAGSKRRVTEAAVRFVLATRGDLAELGAFRAEIDARVEETTGVVGGFGGLAFSSWLTGFCALALLEEASRGHVDVRRLEALVRSAEDRQNLEGGWGHGGRGAMIDFYPTTLVATTWWQLLALGGGRRHGVEVDDDVLDEALALLEDVQAWSGGFPYGGRAYRKGVEAGRTAGVVLGLAALGETKGDMFEDAAGYLSHNVASILDGHASPAMHAAVGALAARLLGEASTREFDELIGARIRAAQDPDGSFADPVEGSPDSLALLGSEKTARAYRTALYAVALCAGHSRFVAERTEEIDDATNRARAPVAAAPVAAPSWTVDGGARAVALRPDVGLVLAKDGRTRVFDPRSGTAIASRDGAPLSGTDRIFVVDDGFARFSGPPLEAVVLGGTKREGPPKRATLTSISPTGVARWTTSCDSMPAGFRSVSDGLVVLGRAGRLRVHLPSDGRTTTELPISGIIINTALTTWEAAGEALYIVSAESRLEAITSSGERRWTRKIRSPRGVNAPAYGAIDVAGDRLFTGTTDGRVRCRRVEDGELLWEVRVDSSVERLIGISDPDVEGEAVAALALGHDGRLHRVEDGGPVWTARPAGRGESLARPRLELTGGRAWVGSPAGHRVVAYDVVTGAPTVQIPLSESDVWDASGDRLVIGRSDRLEGFDVSD